MAATISGPDAPVTGETQARIMRAIARHRGSLSRRDIAKLVGMSSGTLSKAVGPLTSSGLVQEGPSRPEGPGRPSVPLQWGSTYAVLGVRIIDHDDQPDAVIVTATYLDGTPLPGADKADHHPVTREPGPAQFNVLVDEIVEMINQRVTKIAATQPEVVILGCGVAMGGHIDHGDIRMSYDTGWGAPGSTSRATHFPLRDLLAEKLPFDVVLDNDINSLALQELLTNDTVESFAVASAISDGVGASLALAGDMWRGPGGLVGELGHLTVADIGTDSAGDPDNQLPTCRCGQKGHVEAYAAPRSMMRRLGAADFDELATTRTNDARIHDVFYQGGRALGRMLQALILSANPERILLYLPPPLVARNAAFPGAHYQRGLFHEINTTFSTGKDTPIDILQVTSNEIEGRGATAAALLVLGRLIDRVQAGVFTPET
jgi:predicted NBD/HSP70 family sugar kinase